MTTSKYIHIGYPKCLSTTIQRDILGGHPQIMHLGVGIGSNIGYKEKKLESICEVYLKYARNYFYDKKKIEIHKYFNEWFSKSKISGYKSCGISLENFSFNFTSDNIDITDKAKRLHEIFGENTKIIIIIREQFALLKSLYNEAIRNGYSESYSEFIKYTFLMQDRNFLSDFFYHNTVEIYASYFGLENILVIPVEEIKENQGELVIENEKYKLLNEICVALSIDYIDLPISHHNATLFENELEEKRKLNSQYKHDLGNSMYGNGTNFHRLGSYFEQDLNYPLNEKELFKNVEMKNMIINNIKSRAITDNHLSYDCDEELQKRLKSYFKISNEKLQLVLKRILPNNYF